MLPILVRTVLFPMHEALMQRPTMRMLRTLERSQWMPPQQIEALQLERVNALVGNALRHSPWHAQRATSVGIEPGRSLSWDDFRRLPPMSRADIQEHRESIVWRGAPGGVQLYTTGGSSGTPLSFYFGRARQAADAAARMRARRWWGAEPGTREVLVWGAPVELSRTDGVKQFRDRTFNQLLLNAFDMGGAQMDHYLDELERFQPECMYGYASSLALLAAHAQERSRRLKLRGLRVVCTTGEPLYDYQRELIAATFGAPAASEFGSRDIGFTAHEAPNGQLLLSSETVLLEVLDGDGRLCAPGEVGEAVLTGLHSEAHPFIRYRTGDMVRQSDARCRDGRGLHVIAEVMGRSTDFVIRADGTVMHALALIYVLRAVPGIREFKIVQHEVDRVEVLVVPGRQWSDAARAAIAHGLQARLGSEVRIETRVLESIPVAASGKHRYVVSHVRASAVDALERRGASQSPRSAAGASSA